MKRDPRYIPVFYFHWLTRWYDPVMRHLFPEEALKSALIAQASIQPGHEILDIGCGTGTLTLQIKHTHSDALVYGLDVDPEILNIAQRKAKQADKTILLQQGTAINLPYPNESFDRAFISLMLHHLPSQDKRRALTEAFRVLRPGGQLHVIVYPVSGSWTKRCDCIRESFGSSL
ncbi:class I SAM-dependent methyltransferase [Nitrosomonas sp. Is35]|uniref:class I SAM-dependent methyltransferase n=1 Tax=Nitrosomonas sp. Is35 TaxID=3080534 RepID=UPI00294B30B5|nr:class I SAM-dependent methyltransferase [Nitrosomonas sp. Is35]MDV6348888.1 class I SAM-dependent methyltransferase [Nitrosomonas sp. Is35]